MSDRKDVFLLNSILNSQNDHHAEDISQEFKHFIVAPTEDYVYEAEDASDLQIPINIDSESYGCHGNSCIQIVDIMGDYQQYIDKCEDKELRVLMKLNRLHYIKLLQMYKSTETLLLHVQQQRKNVLYQLDASRKISEERLRGSIYKLAYPYFKDTAGFTCKLNADIIKKQTNNELTIYERSHEKYWTSLDCDKLYRGIKSNVFIKKKLELEHEMVSIKEFAYENSVLDVEERVNYLNAQLEALDVDTIIPPLNESHSHDWDRISEVYLKGRFSPEECYQFWSMYLHPSINKSNWSKDDEKLLVQLVDEYKQQNWEAINESHNTQRTAFMLCVHYQNQRTRPTDHKRDCFTREEDDQLISCVDMYSKGGLQRYIPWPELVHKHFPHRTRRQLHHRYTYFLKPLSKNDEGKEIRTGHFSEAEDILLLILFNRFGNCFSKFDRYLPRTIVQIKNRYNCYLKDASALDTAYHKPWTKGEDQIILEYTQQMGDSTWTELASILSRNRSAIRQRYARIRAFMKEYPNCDIGNIPKRQFRKRHHPTTLYERVEFLKFMADRYISAKKLPTIEELEIALTDDTNLKYKRRWLIGEANKKRRTKSNGPIKDPSSGKPTLSNIDDLLIEYFTANTTLTDKSIVTTKQIMASSDCALEFLIMFGAQLSLPSKLIISDNLDLDRLDVQILEVLRNQTFSNEKNINISPPSICTLVALKNLILKHEAEAEKKSADTMLSFVQLKPSSKAPEASEEFQDRFEKLFWWSSILSLEAPSEELTKSITRSGLLAEKYVSQELENPTGIATLVGTEIKRLLVQPNVHAKSSRQRCTALPQNSIIEESSTTRNSIICFTVNDHVPSNSDLEDVHRLNIVLNNSLGDD